jgi:outer membrane protein OmpA-like peptidoglycan-associated protein
VPLFFESFTRGPIVLVALGLLSACQTPPPVTKSQAELDAAKRVRFEDTPQGARAILDESILFETGSAKLSPAVDTVVDVLQPVLAKARGEIVVEGHTDRVGSEAFNCKLSGERAEAVKKKLVERQFLPSRIRTVGHCWNKPRVQERTDDDRRLNRRAEFLFPGETMSSLDTASIEKEAETRLNAFDVVRQKAQGLFKSLTGK